MFGLACSVHTSIVIGMCTIKKVGAVFLIYACTVHTSGVKIGECVVSEWYVLRSIFDSVTNPMDSSFFILDNVLRVIGMVGVWFLELRKKFSLLDVGRHCICRLGLISSLVARIDAIGGVRVEMIYKDLQLQA